MTTTVDAALPADRPVAPSLFDARHRLATLGAVLVITVVAVDAMAVATIMPTTVRDLHGLRFYAWAFTASSSPTSSASSTRARAATGTGRPAPCSAGSACS